MANTAIHIDPQPRGGETSREANQSYEPFPHHVRVRADLRRSIPHLITPYNARRDSCTIYEYCLDL